MNREEFEQWLEDHSAEAIDRIEADIMSLPNWLKTFSRSLKNMVDTYDDDDDDLNFEEA